MNQLHSTALNEPTWTYLALFWHSLSAFFKNSFSVALQLTFLSSHVMQRFQFPFYIFCQLFSSSHFAFSITDWRPQLQTRGESHPTAATNSIISTRGRAISQQGHQGAASEVPLFIYFPQVDSVIHKLNEWQSGQCQQPGAQWRLECICLWVQKPIHYKRVIIVPNRLIHAER